MGFLNLGNFVSVLEKLKDYEEFIKSNHGDDNWITVYKSLPISDKDNDAGMYCALVSKNETNKTMQNDGWDISIGKGGSGFSYTSEKGEKLVSYHLNIDEPFLRLILVRDFNGIVENSVEVLEEFRLLFNLYHDKKNNRFLDFNDSGESIEVINVENDVVKIRRRYLKSFIAVKQMNLLLYFESTWHTSESISLEYDIKEENLTYSVYSGNSYVKGYSSFIRICGKKLITCENVDSCNIWPFEKEKQYQSYIIGGDEDKLIEFTSNPDDLANYFGKNPQAPHYLTPVFFKNEVMNKYYGNSDYIIEDGRLIRNGLWRLRFDNNSNEHIAVFLGDLGRDLPEKEQLYWKSFNIIPDGRKISKTNYERSFLGNFSDSEKAEHIFKTEFNEFQEFWLRKNNWNFFLPLADKDQHFFNSIRTLLSNEQAEFDAQILALAKTTIDSVNTKQLRVFLNSEESKSINLLLVLVEGTEKYNEFKDLLRGLQSIRSSGVAHRKGMEYIKQINKYEIDIENYRHSFDKFLIGLVELFKELKVLNA